MSKSNPYDTSEAVTDGSASEPNVERIESLSVGQSWKERFRLLEKAGGPELSELQELSFQEHMKASFNIFAFLFGPIYYAVKGMWKKGIALFAACALAIIVLSILLEMVDLEHYANSLGFGAAAVFAVRANIDYYKKMVLNDNGWW